MATLDLPDHVHTGSTDIFQRLGVLGSGGYARIVDKVEDTRRPGLVLARKCYDIAPPLDEPSKIDSIRREISIMKRLKHRHVISYVGSYLWNGQFFVLLEQVADQDLEQFLRCMDSLDRRNPERRKHYEMMYRWPGCLIRAMNYVHESRVRHKDIKPANILIMNGTVLLTDFGIAKDFSGLNTSSTTGPVEAKTAMYCAPEVDTEDGKRSRASDIFSLGCVMLEMATIFSNEDGALAEFGSRRRGSSTSRHAAAYCRNPFKILDWIWWCFKLGSADETLDHFRRRLLQLSFLMLDTTPDHRITARQLVDMMSDPRCNDFHLIGSLSCAQCCASIGCPNLDVPLHFLFKSLQRGTPYIPGKEGLTEDTQHLWQAMKARWLENHMH
jgi:serine/threonine protein kinase